MSRRLPACAAAAVAVLCCLIATHPAAADTEPRRATVGIFVTALNSLSFVTNTVIADFWVWTITDADRRSPLETAFVVNEAAKTAEQIGTEKLGGRRWDQQRIRATLNTRLDVSRFPFDHQLIQIMIEESFDTVKDMVYVADREQSGLDPSVNLTGWEIVGWNIDAAVHKYPTSFGNLEHPEASQSPRILFTVELKRHGVRLFIDMSLGAFIAFFMMVLTFRMNPTLPPVFAGRMGVTVATVFTTLISMRVNASVLAAPFGSTLVDRIHVFTLAAGLLTGIAAVAARYYAETGREAQALALDRRVLPIFMVFYFAVVIALISGAIR